MARFTPPGTPARTTTSSTTTTASKWPKAASVLEPITSFLALFTKRATKATKKLANSSSPKASLAKSKQLFTTISNKAVNFRHKKKSSTEDDDDHDHDSNKQDCDFGDGGLWQRSIMMGDKCQPLDFSGVIYYDHNGKRSSELPMKSPRASPLPNYGYANRGVVARSDG